MTGLEIIGLIAVVIIVLTVAEADWGLATFFFCVLAVVVAGSIEKGIIVVPEIIKFLTEDWVRTALGLGAYIIIACFYAPLRWYWFNLDAKETCLGGVLKLYYRPTLNHNIDRIVRWMTLWPTSLAWNILTQIFGKGFRRLFTYLIKKYSFIFESITDSVFGKEVKEG